MPMQLVVVVVHLMECSRSTVGSKLATHSYHSAFVPNAIALMTQQRSASPKYNRPAFLHDCEQLSVAKPF